MRSSSGRRARLACCYAASLPLLVSCCCAARREGLASANPLERARAAAKLARSGDLQAVHQLVDLLEDEDRAVRMYAILALRQLTGTTLGYQYYQSEPERRQAVERWRQALRAGQIPTTGLPSRGTATRPGVSTQTAGQPHSEGPAGSMGISARGGRWPLAGGAHRAASDPTEAPASASWGTAAGRSSALDRGAGP